MMANDRSEPAASSMPLTRQSAVPAPRSLVKVTVRVTTAPRGVDPKSTPIGENVSPQFSGSRGVAVMGMRATGSLESFEYTSRSASRSPALVGATPTSNSAKFFPATAGRPMVLS